MKFGSITTPIITDGLIFNMDAANRASYPRTGVTATDTIGNKVGTLLNGVDFNTTLLQFELDGINDNISISNTLNFEKTDPFTISAWIKVNSIGASDYDIIITRKSLLSSFCQKNTCVCTTKSKTITHNILQISFI